LFICAATARGEESGHDGCDDQRWREWGSAGAAEERAIWHLAVLGCIWAILWAARLCVEYKVCRPRHANGDKLEINLSVFI
jgi:hypothetical protein